MSFKVEVARPARAAFREPAIEQIDRAIDEVDDRDLDPHDAVHQVRKRCKKLRGLIRLFRGPLEDAGRYRSLNAQVRDTARPLSDLRDAEALIEAYDGLMAHYADRVTRRDFANVRRQLTLRRQQMAAAGAPIEERLAQARDRLTDAKVMVADAPVPADGFAAVEDGLAKTYGRARKAMATAARSDDPEDFHEWRKRAKYHRYHCGLLADLWPDEMKARREAAKDVSDWLGDGHDLTVMIAVLEAERERFRPDDPLDRLMALAATRRDEAHAAALPLGRQLFAEKRKPFAARIATYWAAAAPAKSQPTRKAA